MLSFDSATSEGALKRALLPLASTPPVSVDTAVVFTTSLRTQWEPLSLWEPLSVIRAIVPSSESAIDDGE